MIAEEDEIRVSEIRRDKATGRYYVNIKVPSYITNPFWVLSNALSALATANEKRKREARKARRITERKAKGAAK